MDSDWSVRVVADLGRVRDMCVRGLNDQRDCAFGLRDVLDVHDITSASDLAIVGKHEPCEEGLALVIRELKKYE